MSFFSVILINLHAADGIWPAKDFNDLWVEGTEFIVFLDYGVNISC